MVKFFTTSMIVLACLAFVIITPVDAKDDLLYDWGRSTYLQFTGFNVHDMWRICHENPE